MMAVRQREKVGKAFTKKDRITKTESPRPNSNTFVFLLYFELYIETIKRLSFLSDVYYNMRDRNF